MKTSWLGIFFGSEDSVFSGGREVALAAWDSVAFSAAGEVP
jgi:hypothetical protein